MALDEPFAEYQHIHLCSQEAVERFLRTADNRLVLIERGIEYHGYAADFAEGLNQLPVKQVCLSIDSLKTPRAIDMGHCRNKCPFLLADLINLHHEGHVPILFEPFQDMLF